MLASVSWNTIPIVLMQRHIGIVFHINNDTIASEKQRTFEEMTIMLPISKMAAAVQPSATLAAGAKARQMKAEGKNVYDFSLGEPDFTTPEHICDAGYQGDADGHTHYTAASGIAELRTAIARWYQKNYGLRVLAGAGDRLQRRQAFAAQRPGRDGRPRR